MCSANTHHHRSPQTACDLALVSMELLAANRLEGKKKAAQWRMEEWLDRLTTRVSTVEAVGGRVDIPNYSRNLTIRFEDPEVRKRLMKLIDTDVVKILDKDFMYILQNKLYESYWEAFEHRLASRRKWESERRKMLELEGIQPLDDNSLEQHPITQVKLEVERALEVIREQERKPYQTRKRMTWEYNQFMVPEVEVAPEPSEETLTEKPIVDLEELEKQRKQINVKKLEEPPLSMLMSEEFYQRIKYEAPLVKELMEAQSVNDMYDIAEKILEYKEPYTPLTEGMIKTGLKVDVRASQKEPEN